MANGDVKEPDAQVNTEEIVHAGESVQNGAEDVDMVADEQEEAEEDADKEKIRLLSSATSEDGTCASFQISEEDHTLGNALRYIIMKNPDVEFCGYSIPHPSETLLNLRIQTYGKFTAVEVLQKGLQDLMDLCDAVEDKFTQRIREM
ncbi:DNA-directed RNA polymerase core subunit RPC19 [Lachancea thermotolerans CBS 6340]|uniref:KLTH0D09350p n=1 Tax=Lachancea thermotolerans (strain ATCC 56472 / CBS 6340 / NRRL Y-8284) TaxID=559295 RepID=C5DGY8_LACTC|nr:KLTH0D09350p [Lachancea thermotolerans CBS 6340]CAR22680.1 KLTH0D09350p [Lachancea thermotolerans CBS 6340]